MAAPRPEQPAKLKPQPPSRSPNWKLLDWSLKPLPEKPGVLLRASSYQASGKYPFVRVEQEIEVLSNGEARVLKTVEMVGDQIIVKLPEGAPAEEIHSLAAKLGGQAATKPFAPDTWLVAVPRKLEAVPEALAGSTNSGTSIDFAEPNHIVRPMRTPNDPRFTNFSQWHLYNNTQLGVDIKAPRAWDRRASAAYSTNKVIVAVIDTGVRYTHEDLLSNMWTNPNEIPGDGVDNDGNGLIDDIYGGDYFSNEGDPMDGASHGTHCAGLIGALGNNGIGVTGVAWTGIQIMALRFIGPDPDTGDQTGSVSDAIQCIDYAIAKGAKVINASYGSPTRNDTGSGSEASAIYRAQQAGIVLVAAVGNGGTDFIGDNNDTSPFFPASYTEYVERTFPTRRAFALNNIIAVGATDRNDNKASFSNFGSTSVDLMAPGVEMWSTTTSGTSDATYTQGQGTSFAAPVVAGAVALLIAEYPNDTVSQRVGRVVNTNAVDVIPGLSGQCVTGGRLNLAKLLPAADVSTLPQALAWHRPDYTESLISSPMRTPTTLALSNNVTVFSGIKKFNNTNGVNTYGLVNQTGGWLFYRTSSAVSWSSNALAFHTNNGDYQFWKGTLSNVSARTFEYYLQIDFDSGARTTYSYFTNNADGFATTTNQATAESSPYSFTVPKAAATLTLSGTNQTYNGSARPVSVSTTPSGLSNTVTYNGSSLAPTNAGTYTVVATITDSNYQGSVTNTLTVAKAAATLTLGNTSQTYDGSPRSVTATTTPPGISTSITYDGSPTAPVNAGSYAVVATVSDPNYSGSTSGSLQVAKASASVTLSGLSHTYDGSSKPASASTTPAGLTVNLTYDGFATSPTNAGTYAVVGTINESNYSGSSSGTLEIFKASAMVQISNLSQVYDGSSKPVTVVTSPSGLSVSVTYDGSATVPSAVGAYAVDATVTDSNYQGSASGTLAITDPPTPTFASTFGSSTPTSDSDGDGVPALVEYALGGGTNGNDQSLLPVATLSGSSLSMSAVIRTNDTNLLIYPEVTLDLGSSTNWTSSGFTTNSSTSGVPDGFARKTYEFNASTNRRAFLKLTIQQR